MATRDKRIRITIYGGANEVGGNKILLEDFGYDVKVFLDFGVNIKRLSRFKQNINDDPSTIRDLTSEHLLPPENALPFENLYTRNFILNRGEKFNVKTRECKDKKDPETELDAIIISHAHRDHYYGLSFVNRNIPIYTGDFTKNIIIAQSNSSGKNFENFLFGLKWNTFRSKHEDEEGIKIKEMEIFPVHVDHSVPAAYAFVFCTSAGLIAYSGDFRMHGPLNLMTTHFLQKVKELSEQKGRVLALICEGTFIQKGSVESEDRVENQLNELFQDMPFDFCIVKHNSADWDRFKTFVKVSKENDWRYIITEKDAYFYHMLNQDPNHETMKFPRLLDEKHILILTKEHTRGYLFSWQKKVRSIFKRERFVKIRDLRNLTPGFFLHYKCLEGPLHEILPRHLKGAFLSSDIDPYTDERFENTEALVVKLRHLGMPAYRIQASGHAKPHDIYNFVRKINPQILYPVHTTNPKLFKSLFRNTGIKVILPRNATKPSDIFLEAE